MATITFRRIERGVPISQEALSGLMHSPVIIRIVRVMDIASLSTLELLEYNITKQDIKFAFINGVIELDLNYLNANPDPSIVSRIVDGQYDYWNSRKFKLSELGLYMLSCL
jgi:hypothetical protein